MERETDSMTLCRAGCGFYGNSATDGLCSVCFKEALKKKQQQPNNPPSDSYTPYDPISTATAKHDRILTGDSKNALGSCEDPQKSEYDKNVEKKPRCLKCCKKVGLMGFKCRCGGVYCGLHRYSNEHGCTFDYRALGAEELRKNNPVVAGEKIKKI